MFDEMEYTFQQSPEQDQFAPAFVKAQQAMGEATKGADNPFYKSKYADHAEIVAVVKGPLNDHGISYSQWLMTPVQPPAWQVPDGITNFLTTVYDALPAEDKAELLPWLFGTRPKPRMAVMTELVHISGQYKRCIASFPCIKEDPQIYLAVGSYLRRGSLQAIAGVPSVDDDGEEASGRKHDRHAYSKAMVGDLAPDVWHAATFRGIKAPMHPGDPNTALLETRDGVNHFEIHSPDLLPKLGAVGGSVTFKMAKRGGKRVLAAVKSMVVPTDQAPPPIRTFTPEPQVGPVSAVNDDDVYNETFGVGRPIKAVCTNVDSVKKGKMKNPKLVVSFECADGAFEAFSWHTLEGQFQLIGGPAEILHESILITVQPDGEYQGKPQYRIVELLKHPLPSGPPPLRPPQAGEYQVMARIDDMEDAGQMSLMGGD